MIRQDLQGVRYKAVPQLEPNTRSRGRRTRKMIQDEWNRNQ